MKVLVTGLSGFTGKYLKKELEQSGHTVVGLRSNLTDRHAIAAEVQSVKPQAVIHLAAISFVPDGESSEVYAVNTIGTQYLLDAIATLKHAPHKVVLASSSTVYGMQEGVLAEELCPRPPNHYGCSKLAMEHIAATYFDKLPVVITRPFNYTGVDQADKFLVPKIVSHFLQKKSAIELGNIEVERDFSDVRWVARAYTSLMENGQPGECFNLCSGRTISITSIIEALVDMTKHQIDVRINPDFVRDNEIRHQCGDANKIIKLMAGFEPPQFRETLAWMANAT